MLKRVDGKVDGAKVNGGRSAIEEHVFRSMGPMDANRMRLNQSHVELDSLLRGMGFNKIRESTLISPRETLYNRGIGEDGLPNGKSNFFVFMKLADDTLRVMFANPDTSQQAISLSPKEIHRLHHTAGLSRYWAADVAKDVETTAAKKPPATFFIAPHGHWGKINGTSLYGGNLDDGLSDDKTIIRQMMFYNMDYDATGPHNNYPLQLFAHVRELEAGVGITKINSFELTMPYKNGKPNGPHHNIWLANDRIASEYHQRILAERNWDYIAFAPSASREEMIRINSELASQRLLAVGIAHPFATVTLPATGLGNRVATGDFELQRTLEYVGENAHGIAAFSPTTSDRRVKFVNGRDEKYFRGLLEKWVMGRFLTPNALSMAFSLEMRERFGTFRYGDNDTHLYRRIRHDLHVHGLGRVMTVMDLKGTAHEGKKPSAGEVVSIMSLGGIAAEGEKVSRIGAFVPYQVVDGKAELYPSRSNDTFMQKLGEMARHVEAWRRLVPVLARDLAESARDFTR